MVNKKYQEKIRIELRSLRISPSRIEEILEKEESIGADQKIFLLLTEIPTVIEHTIKHLKEDRVYGEKADEYITKKLDEYEVERSKILGESQINELLHNF
jgi:hypothetical protein